MGDIRAAIIGTGFIGRVHARAARLAGARIHGVAASSIASGAAAAAELGAERVYGDPGQVANDPAVDVVHVCTPNQLHAPYARAALAAGKHVVCEKPLGLDAVEALELRDAAHAAGVVHAVPFVYRFHPMVHELRALVADGRLGRLRLIHGGYLQDWLTDASVGNWRTDPALGGASRAFADIGSHWCDLVEFAAGDRIARLSATVRRGAGANGNGGRAATEDAAAIHFETAGGATGVALMSQISPGHKNRLHVELDGTEASASFDQERPDVLVLADEHTTRTLHRGDATLSAPARALSVLPPGHPQGYNDAFAAFVAGAYDAIGSGVPADGLPTFDDGARAALIVDAVLRSAATRAWVEVADGSTGDAGRAAARVAEEV